MGGGGDFWHSAEPKTPSLPLRPGRGWGWIKEEAVLGGRLTQEPAEGLL